MRGTTNTSRISDQHVAQKARRNRTAESLSCGASHPNSLSTIPQASRRWNAKLGYDHNKPLPPPPPDLPQAGMKTTDILTASTQKTDGSNSSRGSLGATTVNIAPLGQCNHEQTSEDTHRSNHSSHTGGVFSIQESGSVEPARIGIPYDSEHENGPLKDPSTISLGPRHGQAFGLDAYRLCDHNVVPSTVGAGCDGTDPTSDYESLQHQGDAGHITLIRSRQRPEMTTDFTVVDFLQDVDDRTLDSSSVYSQDTGTTVHRPQLKSKHNYLKLFERLVDDDGAVILASAQLPPFGSFMSLRRPCKFLVLRSFIIITRSSLHISVNMSRTTDDGSGGQVVDYGFQVASCGWPSRYEYMADIRASSQSSSISVDLPSGHSPVHKNRYPRLTPIYEEATTSQSAYSVAKMELPSSSQSSASSHGVAETDYTRPSLTVTSRQHHQFNVERSTMIIRSEDILPLLSIPRFFEVAESLQLPGDHWCTLVRSGLYLGGTLETWLCEASGIEMCSNHPLGSSSTTAEEISHPSMLAAIRVSSPDEWSPFWEHPCRLVFGILLGLKSCYPRPPHRAGDGNSGNRGESREFEVSSMGSIRLIRSTVDSNRPPFRSRMLFQNLPSQCVGHYRGHLHKCICIVSVPITTESTDRTGYGEYTSDSQGSDGQVDCNSVNEQAAAVKRSREDSEVTDLPQKQARLTGT
ncbi:uncharacterized protein LAESUDRAFT_713658 [Laetiporus sulphureus 93-53]|uniref:Uncharacterized protein n=1 Tax=Laetiporus sulphureus 93-53 TaxID=1314785 RepID=A0A165EIZ2_9APHY|nr:uncharacterized protein LAESUDRAFT_713658 [Laetiporus sulphureus 93-53]KZT07148.1 hypothetical protein LAESUDRAFT_713658 [Laetiporus sulphureus 93-53]